MKQFSKKTDLTLLILSVFFLVVTSLLVLFSNQLLVPMQKFFEYFFRRSVNLSKWAPTIVSLMSYPVFAVILVDAVIFLKFSDRSKNILLCVALLISAFFIFLVTYTKAPYIIGEDDASELILAKECWMNKTFWPRTWHYSTEMRIIQAELFNAPLFFITQNFRIIKAVSGLLSSLCIPLCLYFLLNVLGVRKMWHKLLCCLLVFVPTSDASWTFVQFGSWYAFHIALGFLYAGLFFGIIYDDYSERKKRVFKILFFVLSFVLGLSGMRYLVQFIGPLFIVYVLNSLSTMAKSNNSYSLKEFINNKGVFYSGLGIAVAMIGFLMNQIVLSRFYRFSFTGTFEYGNIGDFSIEALFSLIIHMLGWRDGVSVLSPAGIVNMLALCSFVAFILCAIEFLKNQTILPKIKLFVIFVLATLLINVIAVICYAEFNRQYITGPLSFLLVCVVVFCADENISSLKRYVFVFTLSVAMFTASFFTYGNVNLAEGNKENRAIAEFLEKSGYTLGFSRGDPSTVIAFFTNGKVEVGDVYYENRKCLTSSRYWDDSYKPDENVFLLIRKDEFKKYPELVELENCKKVYEDNNFTVFDFENKKIMKDELRKDKYSKYLDPHDL